MPNSILSMTLPYLQLFGTERCPLFLNIFLIHLHSISDLILMSFDQNQISKIELDSLSPSPLIFLMSHLGSKIFG